MAAAVAASLASGGVESLGFLNDIIEQLWDPINTTTCKMVKEIVEPMFKELLPMPLRSLHFSNINLGKKPIRFDNIDVHKRSEHGIKLDVDIAWDGECDIDLETNLISFGVEKVKLKGRVSVLLGPIVDRLPLVTAMQVAFINPPELSLDFTGAADIADLSIIDDTIRKVIQDVLAMILVLPNRFMIKIDPANDYFATYQQHIGFLRVTVVKASGFKKPKGFLKDIPDMYCITRLGASKTWETSTINNNIAPEWNETRDFFLSDHDQVLSVAVWDDDLARDDDMGSGSISVGKLLMEGKKANIPLRVKGESTGTHVSVKAEVYEFVSDVTSFEAPENQAEGLMCGKITILVAGAKNIPGERKDACSCVKVAWGSQTFNTPNVMDVPGMDPLNPAFDKPFRIQLTAEMAAEKNDFVFTVVNKKNKVGTISVSYSDVLAAPDLTLQKEFEVEGGGPSVSASISIRGIKLAV